MPISKKSKRSIYKPAKKLKPRKSLKPDNPDKMKYGRKVYLKDSKGNWGLNPLVQRIEKGFEKKPVKPAIMKKIQKALKDQGIITESQTSLKSESLTLESTSSENITLVSAVYTPNPFPISLGGYVRYGFRVGFKTALPDFYNVAISLFQGEDLILTETQNFNTQGFALNPETGMYESAVTYAVSVATAAITGALEGIIAGNNLAFYTVSENETPSSETTGVCSGSQSEYPGGCGSGSQELSACDPCTDGECNATVGGCETSISGGFGGGSYGGGWSGGICFGIDCVGTAPPYASSPYCVGIECVATAPPYAPAPYCTGISCVGTTFPYVNPPYYYPWQLSTNANNSLLSMVSAREGKLKMKATQLKEGEKELSLYFSSINVLDVGAVTAGWYFNFGEFLLGDPYDYSIITKFNPEIGRMRYVYDSSTNTYSPYDENYKVKLIKDDVLQRLTLLFEAVPPQSMNSPDFTETFTIFIGYLRRGMPRGT